MFYKQLHGLRGLASFMVFFAHITAGYNLHVNNVIGNHTTQGTLQYYITNIGTFGVEIFFFLSGFVILKSSIKENEKTFFTRRLFRIYPVFLLFSLLFIVGSFITNPESINIKSIMLALSFTNIFFDYPQLTPNAWSVVYEVWYYFGIYYITSLFIKKERLRIIHLLAITVMLWFVVTKPITIYFLLGAFLGFNTEKIEKLLKTIKPISISTLTCILLILISYLIAINTEFGSQGWLHSFKSKEFL
ncbi:acyltransferase family protein, partial [Shewanella algae]